MCRAQSGLSRYAGNTPIVQSQALTDLAQHTPRGPSTGHPLGLLLLICGLWAHSLGAALGPGTLSAIGEEARAAAVLVEAVVSDAVALGPDREAGSVGDCALGAEIGGPEGSATAGAKRAF